jgi:ribonuclease HI
METCAPRVRLKTPWTRPTERIGIHAWTDGSYRKAASLGWVITQDDKGEGPPLAQGARNLGDQQTAFDGEVKAIKQVVDWFQGVDQRHMTIHSDSTSAIARASHTATGPGQRIARNIRNMVCKMKSHGKTLSLVWVKGHQGTPGNEKADILAGCAAEKAGYSKEMSIAHMKLRISEKFRKAKEAWHKPPPPKKSCLDNIRNALAACPCGSTDLHRPLAVRGLPQTDP